MFISIAVLIGFAAVSALIVWLGIRRHDQIARADRVELLDNASRNGRDPSIVSIINQTGDEADDLFGPDSFRA